MKKILIVDDEPDIRNTLREILEYEDYEVEDIDNGIIDESEIELKVMEHLSRFTIFTRMNPIMADFYCTHGVICPSKTVKEIYKKLEKSKKLEVRRTPSTTATGRASTFFADEKKQITELRWRG